MNTFDFTVSAYIKHLTSLHAILEKAKAWQAANKISDDAILGARLALDQFTLLQQVRSAANYSKNSGAVLCGLDQPQFEDVEKNLTDLQGRIIKSIDFLRTLTKDMVKDDLETRLVPLPWMPGKGLTAHYYVVNYAHSNFYFHYTTAYSILRHYGLSIGKGDYMGGVDLSDLS